MTNETDRPRHAGKRRALALHTLTALGELGFARINLREVAARSGVRLGSIHYYFDDKTDLLVCAMRLYKDEFIRGLQQLIHTAQDARQLIDQGIAALSQALTEQAQLHRLWYDVRAQAMFDSAFCPLIEELEAGLTSLAGQFLSRLRGFGASGVPEDPLATYLQIDAWFRYCLQRHLAGDAAACDEMVRRLQLLLGCGVRN